MNSHKNSHKKYLIKKLLYQSNYRGCKEIDIIIGHFAKAYVPVMEYQELLTFDNILKLPDNDIYDWYLKKKPVPSRHRSAVMQKILNFKPQN